MYYVEEIDKPGKILRLLQIVKLSNDKIIVPVNGEKLSEKYQEKLALKTNKILNKTNSNKIVVSNKIKQYEKYIKCLNSYNIEIVNGKWLFEIMIPDILNYIIKQKNLTKEELEISVAINYISDIEIENIKILAQEYKRLNIVTNHIDKLKRIQEDLYEEYGIMITINNNKKKSVSKSNIIINIDFTKELINKYNINEEAIIISIYDDIKINKKRFNGIVIKDYEINEICDTKYSSKEIYEAKFFKKQNFKYIKDKIKKDDIKISSLIGNNGILM